MKLREASLRMTIHRKAGIRDQGTGIRDQGTGIRNQEDRE
jgi:hypothetical protein